MTKILLVGAGNMGFAMAQKWLSQSDVELSVVEPFDAMANRAAQAGATNYPSATELPKEYAPDLIFLAVKPQMMPKVAPEYTCFAKTASFVSVAAGTTISTLQSYLGNAPIIRCMPNTPAAIGAGMMVCVANQAVEKSVKTQVTKLLALSGKTAWIDDEALMDAVTAISGSGPAYVFLMIECLAHSAQALGLPEATALTLARQTVMGAGALAATSVTEPDELRKQVTSPGGTTAAALEILMRDNGLQALMDEATEAARDRGQALAKG